MSMTDRQGTRTPNMMTLLTNAEAIIEATRTLLATLAITN